jgi:hypothetical protein
MSNTRYRQPNSPSRQERYCSSAEYDRGLLCNLVTKRCGLLSAEDRELVYFLQMLSWEEGGLEKLVTDLISGFPERVASPQMQTLGNKPGQIYRADQVKAVRAQLGGWSEFLLRGETLSDGLLGADEDLVNYDRMARAAVSRERKEESEKHPLSYPAVKFWDYCQEHASGSLKSHLEEICLDPCAKVANGKPWYFPNLIATLREYRQQWIAARVSGHVVTEVSKRVFETLDFSLEERCLTVVEGIERIGKTFAARKWCDMHPGLVRYVEVPASTDDISFFRAIASALGVSINLNSKAHELRSRVEAVLYAGHLMLVFDESHRLWPRSRYREAMPYRVEWVSQLVNRKIPVSLVTTPQFFESQKALKRRIDWRDGQFTGRIAHYEPLPQSLSREDLLALTKFYLPGGDEETFARMVDYAESSAKYIAAIQSIVSRARFIARRQNRPELLKRDIKEAMRNVYPSDTALTRALRVDRPGKRQALPLPEVSEPVKPAFTAPERQSLKPDFGARAGLKEHALT